jgi:hypothetical protein
MNVYQPFRFALGCCLLLLPVGCADGEGSAQTAQDVRIRETLGDGNLSKGDAVRGDKPAGDVVGTEPFVSESFKNHSDTMASICYIRPMDKATVRGAGHADLEILAKPEDQAVWLRPGASIVVTTNRVTHVSCESRMSAPQDGTEFRFDFQRSPRLATQYALVDARCTIPANEDGTGVAQGIVVEDFPTFGAGNALSSKCSPQ